MTHLPIPNTKLPIREADWLSNGYVISLRQGGGIHLCETKPGEPLERAQRIITAIDEVAKHPDSTAIFLTKEDCALVTEFYPDLLTRRPEPPMLGKTITF